MRDCSNPLTLMIVMAIVFLIIFLACLFTAVAFGVMAAMTDFRGMKIPNLYSVLIFAAFVVCYGALWVGGYADSVFSPLLSHVSAFAAVFVITLLLFFARVWGAGDQKLISAYAIWFGIGGLPVFLIYTTLFGGILGVGALVLRKWKPFKTPPKGSWIDQVQAGASKVPYGMAITAGALASFVKIGYVSFDTLRIFS